MISTKKATEAILQFQLDPILEEVDLNNSLNRVLGKDIYASRDFPPFNRVAMDGIAIKYLDYNNGCKQFRALGLQAAGSPPMNKYAQNCCIEVMTGAMLPNNYDTVIPYEHLTEQNNTFLLNEEVIKGKNIHLQGKDLSKGSLLLSRYEKIRPHTLSILATEGIVKVPVLKLPKICIISTGDELVDIEENPLPYQIRKSNSYMLNAALQKHAISADIFHINDDYEGVLNSLKTYLDKFDVLLLSGGVSKGKLDFIPQALEALGVNKTFHRIAQRPGKPFWFGHKENKFVFAFPGNPASTLLCFKKYFEPWIEKYLQQPLNLQQVKLVKPYEFKPDLTYFAQAKLIQKDNTLHANIISGNGSGDLANFSKIDGFVELPQGQNKYDCHTLFNFYKI